MNTVEVNYFWGVIITNFNRHESKLTTASVLINKLQTFFEAIFQVYRSWEFHIQNTD